MGEYGSVVFISGNMPLRTEIVPLLILSRLEDAGRVAYVRPHDLLVRRERPGQGAIAATVEHVLLIGPTVRLLLSRSDDPGAPIEAELDKEQFRGLVLREGEDVFVTPGRPHVFDVAAV